MLFFSLVAWALPRHRGKKISFNQSFCVGVKVLFFNLVFKFLERSPATALFLLYQQGTKQTPLLCYLIPSDHHSHPQSPLLSRYPSLSSGKRKRKRNETPCSAPPLNKNTMLIAQGGSGRTDLEDPKVEDLRLCPHLRSNSFTRPCCPLPGLHDYGPRHQHRPPYHQLARSAPALDQLAAASS